MPTKELSDHAEERRMIKLEEVASAITDILTERHCDKPGWVMKKETLFELVPDRVEENRVKGTKNYGSYRYVPVINGRIVPIPGMGFCMGNWRDIKLFAAEYGYYIVSRLKGERSGIRLGNLDEFTCCQDLYVTSAEGMADTYNERAVTIEGQGGDELPEMIVRIRQYRERQQRKVQDDGHTGD